jgi:predicted ATPase
VGAPLFCSSSEVFLNEFFTTKFSGAGKTTLLNTLLSRNLKGLEIEGSVLVEGNSLGRQMTQVRF